MFDLQNEGQEMLLSFSLDEEMKLIKHLSVTSAGTQR